MAFNLAQKNALITGATGKLTRHLVERLAQAGVNLALHYHANTAVAEELRQGVDKQGCTCKIYPADLTDTVQTQELAQSVLSDFGRVDILINAASIFTFRRLTETDDAFWQRMFDVNLTAPFRLVRALEKNFRTGEGAMLNFADIWGFRPKPAILAYSVAKAGLVALTKALAEEFAPNTTVNALAPGLVDFPPGITDAQRKSIYSRIPLGRLAEPAEIVDLALAILTNRYVTGQVFTIDGGRSLI